jgi:hypothetical protein
MSASTRVLLGALAVRAGRRRVVGVGRVEGRASGGLSCARAARAGAGRAARAAS